MPRRQNKVKGWVDACNRLESYNMYNLQYQLDVERYGTPLSKKMYPIL